MSIVSLVLIGVAVASAIGASLFIFLYLRKSHNDTSRIHSIGIMSRSVSDSPELQQRGYIVVKPQLVPATPLAVVPYLQSKVSRAILVVGGTGRGKTAVATYVLSELITKSQKKVVIFSLKSFPEWADEDFVNLPNCTVLDMTQFLPTNIFSNADRVASAYALALLSGLSLKGMMYQSVKNQVRNLITNDITSWDDLKKKIEKVKKERSSTFDISVLNSVQDSIEQFTRFQGRQENLKIDWKNATTNYVLSFSKFGDENLALKIFHAEYVLRDLFSKQLGFMITIDEGHFLLREGSITGLMLRTGRVSTDLMMITQGVSDIERAHMQFGTVFAFHTLNRDDIDAITDEFGKDCLRQLKGHQFVDLTELHGGETRILELDVKGTYANLDKLKTEEKTDEKESEGSVHVQPIKEDIEISETVSKAPVQVANPSGTVDTPKLDKTEIKKKIVDLLENNAMNISPINYALGIERDDANGKFFVKKCLDELVKEKEIRVMKYVIAKKEAKPKKFYFRNENAHTITPIHEGLVADGRKEIEKVTHVINDYDPHYGWDITTKFFEADAKSGLEHDTKLLLEKIKSSKKIVVVFCVNYDVRDTYKNALGMVEGIENKWRCVCLDSLEDVSREW